MWNSTGGSFISHRRLGHTVPAVVSSVLFPSCSIPFTPSILRVDLAFVVGRQLWLRSCSSFILLSASALIIINNAGRLLHGGDRATLLLRINVLSWLLRWLLLVTS